MDNICRLCGISCSHLVSLFSFDNGRIITDLIILLIPIRIKMDEEKIPKNICQNCLTLIRSMHELRNKSIKNDEYFRNLIKSSHPVKIEKEFDDTTIVANERAFTDEIDYKDEDDSDWNLPESETTKTTEGIEKESFRCDLCDEKFLYQSNLARHHRLYHKDTSNKFKYYMKSVKCPVCDKKIPQQTNLKRHMIQYHDSNHLYGCPQCSYRFARLSTLKKHGIKVHNIANINYKTENEQIKQISFFQCDICGNKYVDKNSIIIHMHKKHKSDSHNDVKVSNKKFQCEYCAQKFSIRCNMFRHYQQMHSKQLPYQCDKCGDGFRTDRLFLKHMEKIHLIQNPYRLWKPRTKVPASYETLICEFCSEDCTNSKYRYERHLIVMHEEHLKDLFECKLCRKKFYFKDSWDQHNAWHTRKSVEKKYDYACDMCERKFPTEERLEKHKIGYHAGQSSLVCHICGKQMRNKSSLNFHVKRHSEKRDYACPQCPQSFVYIKELERHMISHTDNRKYVCSFEGCTKRFNDLYVFQLHKKRHLGLLERKHHCEFCEKRFTTKYALDRHVLTHTQQRPHACEYCSMAYTQKNDLIKHLREHVGDAIYKCDFNGCNEGFRLKFELKQHYAVHFIN